jgi:drug/metabolite transporter (DMT)-like permease
MGVELNGASWAWLWVPVVVFAAAAQTVRNAAQRSLTSSLGTWPATLVRFLYGLPFAVLCLVLLYAVPAQTPAWPNFSWAYLAWIVVGAAFQIGATAALLLAMQQRNFAVAVTLSKSEVLQVALFGAVFLAEWPSLSMWGAMALATAGVMLLSLPPRLAVVHGGTGAPRAWWSRSAGYGLLCGACFAIATVGFRGAALALDAPSPWLSAAWGVTLAQLLQSIGLGAWIALRSPGGLWPVLRAWRVSLLAGSMGAVASLAWFSAYAMHSVAAVRTVGMVEVLFSLLVSRRIFREQLRGTEKLGLGLMLAGIVLICVQYG